MIFQFTSDNSQDFLNRLKTALISAGEGWDLMQERGAMCRNDGRSKEITLNGSYLNGLSTFSVRFDAAVGSYHDTSDGVLFYLGNYSAGYSGISVEIVNRKFTLVYYPNSSPSGAVISADVEEIVRVTDYETMSEAHIYSLSLELVGGNLTLYKNGNNIAQIAFTAQSYAYITAMSGRVVSYGLISQIAVFNRTLSVEERTTNNYAASGMLCHWRFNSGYASIFGNVVKNQVAGAPSASLGLDISWQSVPKYKDRGFSVKSSGFGGDTEFYAHFYLTENEATNSAMIGLSASIGFTEGGLSKQTLRCPSVFISHNNAPSEYVFRINAGNIVILNKASTYRNFAYVGQILQWVSPAGYKFPLYCGGMAKDLADWTDTSKFGFSCVTPKYTSDAYQYISASNSALFTPAGAWRFGGLYAYLKNSFSVAPYAYYANGSMADPAHARTLDGQIPLTALSFWGVDDCAYNFGQLDGVYYCPDDSVQDGQLVDIGGKTHMIIQNYGQAGGLNFLAVRLD